MKALKEKRISLRSLWRRSLVILSLLALVFVACGDGDGDGGSNAVWATSVVSITGTPTNNSYQ